MLIKGTSASDFLFGTVFDDTILAGAGADTIMGSAGADSIDGGDGSDTVNYAASARPVQIDLTATVQHGGDAEGDQLISVENIVGSSFADRLVGNNELNSLFGGVGNDKLFGGFDGKADLLDGGAGSDTVDYSSAPRSMTIALNLGDADGSATLDAVDLTGTILGTPYVMHLDAVQEDTLRNIENVIGSAADDHITGNAADNRLEGGAGQDVINGGTGSDLIIGGLGGDQLFGGNDSVSDTFVFRDFHDSTLHTKVVNHVVVEDGIDTIMDFHPGQDKIDLSGMNAQLAGGAHLHWIDTNASFTGHAGEVVIMDPSLLGGNIDTTHNGSSNELFVRVYADMDGDGVADFNLVVASPFSLDSPQHSDFLL